MLNPPFNFRDRGKVCLVGGGPGAAAYLTLRGAQLLAQAEVLVYDALIDTQLLELAPPHCEQLPVGKRGGRPSVTQAEINQLLVSHCQAGKQVVRLKGGDPFIFGRCAEEIQALQAADCAFEVVPGISSALAAPLLAGIPLTDPAFSHCFAVCSAHDPLALDWEVLARLETLTILMGTRHLAEIVRQLKRYGRSAQTPVSIIHRAGQPRQQVWTGTLATICDRTAGISLSPAVIVVGEVVRLREFLQPPDWQLPYPVPHLNLKETTAAMTEGTVITQPTRDRALAGKTVIVTRSASQSTTFRDLLEEAGAQVVELPALEIVPPSSWQPLDDAIAQLSQVTWLILTSANGVDGFFQRLAELGKDARDLAGVKLAVVGKKTAASLKQHGLQPDFIPPNFVADSLVESFPESLPGNTILFPRVESGGREVLVKELSAGGATMWEVPAYQSRCPDAIAPEALEVLQQGTVDILTFASSKTVKHVCQLLQQADPQRPLSDWVEGICLASIGPQTSQTCQKLLGHVDVEATEYTLEGLTNALIAWANSSR